MIYKAKKCWVHFPSQRVDSYKPANTLGWYHADSRFEARVGLILYRWSCRYDWKLLTQCKIPLNTGCGHLKPRYWTVDFKLVKGSDSILVEAKGICDQRFRDVLGQLELNNRLANLIICGQTPETRDAVIRQFLENDPYPVIVIDPETLYSALSKKASSLERVC